MKFHYSNGWAGFAYKRTQQPIDCVKLSRKRGFTLGEMGWAQSLISTEISPEWPLHVFTKLNSNKNSMFQKTKSK